MSDKNNGPSPENLVPVEKPLVDPFWKRALTRGDFLTSGGPYCLRSQGFVAKLTFNTCNWIVFSGDGHGFCCNSHTSSQADLHILATRSTTQEYSHVQPLYFHPGWGICYR
jgi:hypothetical protein